jgi:hypothetical protein
MPTKFTFKLACGESREFTTNSQKEYFFKLHKNKCDVCKNALRISSKQSVKYNIENEEELKIHRTIIKELRNTFTSLVNLNVAPLED